MEERDETIFESRRMSTVIIYMRRTEKQYLNGEIDGGVVLQQFSRKLIHAENRVREEHCLVEIRKDEGDETHAILEQRLSRDSLCAVVYHEQTGVRRVAVYSSGTEKESTCLAL